MPQVRREEPEAARDGCDRYEAEARQLAAGVPKEVRRPRLEKQCTEEPVVITVADRFARLGLRWLASDCL